MFKSLYTLIPLLVFLFIWSCNDISTDKGEDKLSEHALFELLPHEVTGITFTNELTEGINTNVLVYEYFYNGGGVAVGDLNGDGLDDIYFTGNMVSNKLYLNKGELQFEDITEASGTQGRMGPWTTGVTMVDINGDGLLDIYVCYSGNLPSDKRTNQLFINQGTNEMGIPQFKEEADGYGLALSSFSTQAIFFDYDKDGDLDMFLLNHNTKSLPILDESTTAELLKQEDPAGSQLFRNDNGKFTDVTQSSGIQNSALSYGLGVGVADVNNDGWPDIYVSNDYTAPDFLYINNGDGTFSNISHTALGHISQFSMGSDLADINNDGLIDIFTLDMLPEDNRRQKLLMAPDNYEKFDFMVNMGFHHQYMRNMLHINNGNGTFSEIGQIAGISNTDWSWAPLFADFDNDGWKDLYITNGYQRDYTNLDFLKYMGNYVQSHQGNLKRQNILDLVEKIPASNIKNYLYMNTGGASFENKTAVFGMDHHSNSNGAVYADLDNDGDLDLIVNNINEQAFIYRNTSEENKKNRYLKIKLEGEGKNRFGLGARVTLYSGGNKQLQEQMPTRGYQSSVSPILHFGLGAVASVDSLMVQWQNGRIERIRNVDSNQLLVLSEKDADNVYNIGLLGSESIFKKASIKLPEQTVPSVNDFKRQALLPNPISGSKAALAKGDINGDGIVDLFIGGLCGGISKLYIGKKDGSYQAHHQTSLFTGVAGAEDTKAIFLDVNGNGFLDLYVASGGYGHFEADDALIQDRLYINDGKGGFELSSESLPIMLGSTSTVAANDINGDGAVDLFIGGRVKPGQYPVSSKSYILINDGKGKFSDETVKYSDEISNLGMVTDAVWIDLDRNGKEDLVVVGEWMPILVFINTGSALENKTPFYFPEENTGWWNTIAVHDINKDGKPDLIVGNYGTNSQINASTKEPAELFFKDFDDNGSVDPIFTSYIQGNRYPYLTRDELFEQFTNKRNKFPDYASYADADLEDIFTKEELEGAGYLKAVNLKTSLFFQNSDGKFINQELPIEAQYSQVHCIHFSEENTDGGKYMILAGNYGSSRLRIGRMDANYGSVFHINIDGQITYIPQYKSGLNLKGDIRNIVNLGNRFMFNVVGKGVEVYDLL
ncbi:VCBS repeat-containing protein [Anditalea andensis]|uniref:RNA-binding protein n=1 Tax=Anditalea andensis TaxID=1048983 RepID=A0A074LHH6_9BACT|nr:VCBS repeat-containing protein [Anditalea andensis]KEO73237.1 RNA-binding protein [Anditalea andensis]